MTCRPSDVSPLAHFVVASEQPPDDFDFTEGSPRYRNSLASAVHLRRHPPDDPGIFRTHRREIGTHVGARNCGRTGPGHSEILGA